MKIPSILPFANNCSHCKFLQRTTLTTASRPKPDPLEKTVWLRIEVRHGRYHIITRLRVLHVGALKRGKVNFVLFSYIGIPSRSICMMRSALPGPRDTFIEADRSAHHHLHTLHTIRFPAHKAAELDKNRPEGCSSNHRHETSTGRHLVAKTPRMRTGIEFFHMRQYFKLTRSNVSLSIYKVGPSKVCHHTQ